MEDNNKLVESEKSSENLEDLENIDEILEGVPEEHKKTIQKLIISSIQMRGMISSENEVAKKITEEHITQYLEGSKLEMENSYEEKKHKKILVFLTIFLTMAFIVVIILLLKDIPDIMEKIIYTIGGLAAGAIGGYGFGKFKNDE